MAWEVGAKKYAKDFLRGFWSKGSEVYSSGLRYTHLHPGHNSNVGLALTPISVRFEPAPTSLGGGCAKIDTDHSNL